MKLRRRIRQSLRRIFYFDGRVVTAGSLVIVILVLIGGAMVYKNYKDSQIDPTAYTPLLNTIAKGESRGNYNAYFGHADNTSLEFTDMTIAQVLAWQAQYVQQGSPSSAVGKYQIIRPTLSSLVEKLQIDPATKFDAPLQDKLAVSLLEKRGAKDYMSSRISREQFAANLAKEWAALPRVTGPNPDQSYYAGDGINKEQISTTEIFSALASIKQ
jgi:muramidase (phage lysozyme)